MKIQKLGLKLDKYSFVADSRVVAEIFGKRHDNFIQRIENILKNIKDTDLNFKDSILFVKKQYKDNSGKTNKYYEMSRDGFSLVVMGLTGNEALKWKLEYIKAFNILEEKLLQTLEENKALAKELSEWYPKEEFGTINKDGIAKVKKVRGYFRGDKNSELAQLLAQRKKIEQLIENTLMRDVFELEVEKINFKIEQLKESK